jgi:hypothetical protein
MKKILIAGMINLLLLNIVLAEDKWEYKIFESPFNVGIATHGVSRLNILGEAGWELITVNPESNRWVFIFKRKIEDD